MNATHDSTRRTRPGGRSTRVRAAVLDAALQILAESGFDQMEVPEVARRAGVHAATVYRRWGSKARLVGEAVLEQARPLTPTPDMGSVEQDLVQLLLDGGALIHTPPVRALLEVLLHEQAAPSAEILHARDRFWAAHVAEVRTIVDRAIVRSELPPGADPVVLVEQLIGPVLVRALFLGRDIRAADAHETVKRALAAVRATASPPNR